MNSLSCLSSLLLCASVCKYLSIYFQQTHTSTIEENQLLQFIHKINNVFSKTLHSYLNFYLSWNMLHFSIQNVCVCLGFTSQCKTILFSMHVYHLTSFWRFKNSGSKRFVSIMTVADSALGAMATFNFWFKSGPDGRIQSCSGMCSALVKLGPVPTQVAVELTKWSPLLYTVLCCLPFTRGDVTLQGIVKVGAVNADEHSGLGSQYGVKGFPTIKFFGDDKYKPLDYQSR